jgi:hypothetical protein
MDFPIARADAATVKGRVGKKCSTFASGNGIAQGEGISWSNV